MTHRSSTIALVALLMSMPAAGCGSEDPPASEDPSGCDSSVLRWTVWVTNQGERVDTVSVLEASEGAPMPTTVLATIPVGRGPHNIGFSIDRRFAYVANLGTPPTPGTVSVIDTSSYEVVATIEAGIKPHGLAVSPDGNYLWVANVGSDDLTVIDLVTLEPEPNRIAVGRGPALVAFLPNGSKAYVSNGDGGTTSVIDVEGRAVIKSLRTGLGAMGLAVSHDGRFVFETEGFDNQVSAIDTASDTIVNEITFDQTLIEPHGIAIAGDELIITNRSADALSFMDMATFERSGSIAVAGRPDIIGVAPNCGRAYLTLRDSPSVAVIDLIAREQLGVYDFGVGDVHGVSVLAAPVQP